MVYFQSVRFILQDYGANMKIAILGNAGSGKSTLGLRLHKFLDLSLIHLDQHFWKPGWVEPERAEFEKIHNRLCEQDQWVIEGMSVRNAEYRIQNADIVIYLDVPRHICFFRIFKRAIENFGTVNFSSAKGCPERGPSIKFLKYVWYFDAQRKPDVLSLFEKYKDKKRIYILHNEN